MIDPMFDPPPDAHPDGKPERGLPFATVIIPVKDGIDLLTRCVEALLAQDYPADRFEIIVADNGSSVPPAAALPEDPRVILIEEPRPGSYAARNTALGHARGEILAFTDADCRPEPGWLRTAARFLADHPDVAMIGGQVRLEYRHGGRRNGPEWFEFVQGFPQEQYLRTGFAVTANMVTRRTVVERIGEFDATLMSGGDAEWGRRVRSAGLVQRYLPDAVVHHPARDTWNELRTKTVRTTTGIVRRTAKAARPRPRLARLLAGQLARSVLLPVVVLRRRDLPTWSARRLFLLTRWRVDAIIVGILVRGLVRPRPAATTIDPKRT